MFRDVGHSAANPFAEPGRPVGVSAGWCGHCLEPWSSGATTLGSNASAGVKKSVFSVRTGTHVFGSPRFKRSRPASPDHTDFGTPAEALLPRAVVSVARSLAPRGYTCRVWCIHAHRPGRWGVGVIFGVGLGTLPAGPSVRPVCVHMTSPVLRKDLLLDSLSNGTGTVGLARVDN